VDLQVGKKVSEEHTASVFKAEVNFTIYIFTAVRTSNFPNMAGFWVVAPYSLVEVYRCLLPPSSG
jgi:hypothetical protein